MSESKFKVGQKVETTDNFPLQIKKVGVITKVNMLGEGCYNYRLNNSYNLFDTIAECWLKFSEDQK